MSDSPIYDEFLRLSRTMEEDTRILEREIQECEYALMMGLEDYDAD